MIINPSENIAEARGAGRHAWCGLLLAIVPGFGQFYHRQWLKGIVFLVLLSSFMSIFYDFLSEGLWGLYTLGEEVPRDNSIFLLAEGIISVLIIAFGLLVYFLSLRDAWINGKKRDEGMALNSVRKQYQMLLSDGFPYLMITPGFILLVFVVIFPILFGFAIAFTNYNLYHTPPAKLVDWVGFKNFINIFTLSIWRSTFFDVLQWTVVWTLLATTLQCTVGVLLAILVNQKDLRFKPMIRTIFILPWAVPGFVTILVFAGMFNDSFGVINNAILSFFGISPKAWLTDPFWTKTALIMMQTWLGFPFVFAMTRRFRTISMKRPRWMAPARLPGCGPLLCRWCCTRLRQLLLLSTPSILITSISSICSTTAGLRWRGRMPAVRIFWCRGSTNSPCRLRNTLSRPLLRSCYRFSSSAWRCGSSAPQNPSKMTIWRKGSNMAKSPSIKREKWIRLSLTWLVVIFVSTIIIYPLVWTVGASLNAGNSLLSTSIIPENLSFQHYADLFNGNVNYLTWYWNSMKISFMTMLLTLISVSFTAYAFSRFRFKGRQNGLMLFLLLQMIPQFSALIAIFVLSQLLGLINSHLALVLIYVGGMIPMNTWLMKGYLDAIPKDLDESARMDGASSFRIFFEIIMPLSKPILAVVALFSFTGPLGDFILSSTILRTPDKYTLPIGLYNLVAQKMGASYTTYAAGAVLIAVPVAILYLALQKYFVSGLTSGSTKG